MLTLILPGLGNSGPEHWQSLWERRDPSCRRVEQLDWEKPQRSHWVATLDEAVDAAAGPLVLVAHSSACAMVAHWAKQASAQALDKIAGAFLVAPSDPLGPNYPVGPSGFDPVPLERFPFPATVAASDDDPYVTLERAREFSQAWGARLAVFPGAGHINTASGHGAWEEGFALMDALRKN